MKNQMHLSIPTPCQEKWDTFRSTQQGGYCSSCEKEVIDFTKWTAEQIKDYFRHGNNTACGRFRTDQLKSYTLGNAANGTRWRAPLSALGISLLLSFNAARAEAKPSAEAEITLADSLQQNTPILPGDTLGRKIISGVIKDGADGLPMPGVNVILKGTNFSTISDAGGRFSFEMVNVKAGDMLTFSFLGYETFERSVFDKGEWVIVLKIDETLFSQPVIMGGICARRLSPRTIWWRIKNVFR
jgi:hypothetical protein